ncbi:MAG: glycosyltransferase family 2 protein, partial [Oscillospiraceae bacterium]
LWFLRESKYLNNVRSLLSSSCAISGTGFLFSREIIKKAGGWNFFLLTEDIEFTVYNVLNGEKIGYCSTAVLYDEQPLKFSQSLTQRMRWAKGYLQVFRKHGKALVKNVFTKLSFSCFDMCMTIMPAIILTTVSCIVNLAAMTMGVIAGQNFFVALQSVAEAIGNAYLLMFLIGLITTISEWKHIHTTTIKKILYTFTFPLFMFTYIPISFIAMFKKVTWQPIRHTECKTLNQLKELD